MPDPDLTPRGKEQAEKLRTTFPYHDVVDLVVSSPIRRALQTALLGFEEELKRGLKIIALPDLQETSSMPCDTGGDVEKLEKEFGSTGKVDLSLVGDDWNKKTGKYASSSKAVGERARAARKWLRDRPEKNIVVVTHGGFLHYLSEEWVDHNTLRGTGWDNTEFRSYKFVEDEDDDDPFIKFIEENSGFDNATIVETDESRRRRRGSEKPLTTTEKLELEETIK